MNIETILSRIKNNSTNTVCVIDADGREIMRCFSEVAADIEKIIAEIEKSGLQKGDRVAMCSANTYEWIVWDIALLVSGMVSFMLPEEQLEQITFETVLALQEKHRISLFVLSPSLFEALSPQNDNVLPMAIENVHINAHIKMHCGIHSEDLMSCIYSSGTTGRPKGLLISKHGLMNLLYHYNKTFGIYNTDLFLTFLPFSGQQQRNAYYGCLYYGCSFISVPHSRIFQVLKEKKPTCMIAPPVFYETIYKIAANHARPNANRSGQDAVGPNNTEQCDGARLTNIFGGNIRYLITGMAPINRLILEYYWQQNIALYEAYGINESGIVTWNCPGNVKLGSQGRLTEENSIRLAHDGEVIVARQYPLSIGYFDSPEQDQENTFIGSGEVATGDIAEIDEKGFLTLIGRKKAIIVTKQGKKFHPEEIEKKLSEFKCIEKSVVVSDDTSSEIIAILKVSTYDDIMHNQLAKIVSTINVTLSDYMKIDRFIAIDCPVTRENGLLTHSMKINRRQFVEQFILKSVSPPKEHANG